VRFARQSVASGGLRTPRAPTADGRVAPARRPERAAALKRSDARAVWGWLPTLILVSAAALLAVAVGHALGRSGRAGGQPLFWLGVLAPFALASVRLVSRAPSRRERVGIVVVVGMSLYLVKVFQNPFVFLYSDEFNFAYNAQRVLDTHSLFSENPILAVSADYPGLATATSAVAELTGLGVLGAGLLVIAVARLLVMLALFLLFEEISRSARIGGLAALLYAAHPNFLFYSAEFGYESLALPLAALALVGVTRWMRREDDGLRRAWSITALIAMVAVVMTHHMTTYALLAFLIAAAGASALLRRTGTTANPWPFALFAGLVTIGWLVFVASETVGYVTFIFTRALRAAIETALNEAPARELFESDKPGAPSQSGEQFIAVASVVLIAAALPIAARHVWRRHRRPVPLVLTAAAIGYLAMLSLRFIPNAWEIGNRTSEFLFVGVAFALAIAGLRVAAALQPFLGRIVLVSGAVLVFAGGVVAALPPDLRLSLPYRISVEDRVLEPQGAAAARWARAHLGENRRILTDESNGRLLLTEGQLPIAGGAPNKDGVLVDDILAPWMVKILREERADFVLMDRRRIRQDRLVAYYFASERATRAGRYQAAWAEKLDRQPGTSRLFDSGDIAIYDIRRLRYQLE
jgi:hypothetical protein